MNKALLVGLTDYKEKPLEGPINDINCLEKILSKHYDGAKNFDCGKIIRTSTRKKLREKLIEFFCSEDVDTLFFHFSGHGKICANEGYLVTTDAEYYDFGISVRELLSLANNAKAKNTLITLDCCYSGKCGIITDFGSNNSVLLSKGVSIITASTEKQPSIEDNGMGIFSSLLYEALDAAADILGKISIPSIYSHIEQAFNAWEQRPLMKSNLTSSCVIRKAKPKIDINILRKITELFKLPAEDLKLSPEYEPENSKCDDKKVEDFKILKKFRNIGLVEPVEADDMYFVAMGSKFCRLTALGKYYWRLVSEGKI
ncbi:hypothetical protein AGMMS5026_03780 [Endomicrobiia bacterium]|nr:hypothetical protein AGMMS49523_01880 [Endomicrobiia bacterium]GHT13190.1 hypothetical protein AGMMS49571_06460 [Endomicrobiia bacterium]GHT20322.1 hypothetical protein AGMMS49929_06510 [Endomicrobiia bacterium]GHT26337.1 hypothetical protein AGMMS49995_02750 [Endomicrobiia bacterium]GHT30201.1 hypothetical protein AGMMS5026_03780 [Endomicrobiia bacterium]